MQQKEATFYALLGLLSSYNPVDPLPCPFFGSPKLVGIRVQAETAALSAESNDMSKPLVQPSVISVEQIRTEVVSAVMILCEEMGIDEIYMRVSVSDIDGYPFIQDIFVRGVSLKELNEPIEMLKSRWHTLCLRLQEEIPAEPDLVIHAEKGYLGLEGKWLWSIKDNKVFRIAATPFWVPTLVFTSPAGLLATKIAFPTQELRDHFMYEFCLAWRTTSDILCVSEMEECIIQVIHYPDFVPHKLVDREVLQHRGEEDWEEFQDSWSARHLLMEEMEKVKWTQ